MKGSVNTVNKKKILCFHGGNSNSFYFKNQKGMTDLIESLPEFEFIFLDSPSGNNLWWDSPDDKNNPTTTDKSVLWKIIYLNQYVKKNGPFYGLLGFSQGASMIIVYLSYTLLNFKKIGLFNGYLPKTHLALMDKIHNEKPLNDDVLIFVGENDPFKDLSLEIKKIFTNNLEIISNYAGHNLPNKSDDNFENIKKYFRD